MTKTNQTTDGGAGQKTKMDDGRWKVARAIPAVRHLPSAILGFALFSATPPAAAQTSVDLMLKPFQKDVPIELNAGAMFLDQGHTDRGTDTDYRLSVAETTARYRFLPEERMDPRLGFAGTFLSFDSANPLLPDNLLDVSGAVGFGVYEERPGGWQAGVTLGAGYAGAGDDDYFSDANAWYGKASLIVGKKFNKTDGLLFVVDYNGNRTFKPDVPLPGFAYQKLIFGNPDPDVKGGPFQPQLLMTLGLPFASLHWEPLDRLSVDVTYLIPDEFGARVDYDVTGGKKLGVYGSIGSRRDAFHADALEHGDDRILFYQRRAEVGVRWSPVPRANLLVAGGYAFGQELTTGFDSQDDDKLTDLSDRPFVRFSFELGF